MPPTAPAPDEAEQVEETAAQEGDAPLGAPVTEQALERISQLKLDATQTRFSSAQVAVMRVLGWNLSKLTPPHVEQFIYFCVAHNLDPFAGEAMPFVTEEGQVVPLIKIAGLRNRAVATGEYRGTGRFEFLAEDGTWTRDWVPATMGRPQACRVDVQRAGWLPTEGIVFTEEVEVWEVAAVGEGRNRRKIRQLTERWRIGEHGQGQLMTMLAKCAEAAALRRAFPRELDGFYVPEETERLRKERKEQAAEAQRVEGEAARAAAYADAHPEPPARAEVSEGVVEGVVVDRATTMRSVDRLRAAATTAPPEPPLPPEPVAAEEEPPPVGEDAAAVEEVPAPPVVLSPDERAECLRVELEMQAEILGIGLATLVARFETIYEAKYATWDDEMLLRVVARYRKQVTAKLARDPVRVADAQAYARVGADEVVPISELPAR